MEFIKVKSKHYLNTNLTLLEMGCLVKFQLLVSHFERPLTEKEIARELPQATWRRVADKLQELCVTPADITQKVCEDVADIMDKRCTANARKKKWRDNHKFQGGGTRGVHATDKIREDKIRVDKTTARNVTPQAELVKAWEGLYNSETGKVFKASSKDYLLATKLIKDSGLDEVIARSKILFELCKKRSAWFSKDGMADFTIGKLSSHWNSLIAGVGKNKNFSAMEEFLRKEEENEQGKVGKSSDVSV